MRMRVKQRDRGETDVCHTYHRLEGVVRHRLGVLQPRRPRKEGDKSEKPHPSQSEAAERAAIQQGLPAFTHHGELIVDDNVKKEKKSKIDETLARWFWGWQALYAGACGAHSG